MRTTVSIAAVSQPGCPDAPICNSGMPTEQDARIAGLIDERRKVAARLADLDMQIAQAVGDREGMRRAQHEMYAQVEARKAARFAAWEASH